MRQQGFQVVVGGQRPHSADAARELVEWTNPDVGGGNGMICYEFKGGTGSSSRKVSYEGGHDFTVGALVQANRCLKPDGLFLGAILGGDTLHELRDCLMQAELDLRGGVSPRLSGQLARPRCPHLHVLAVVPRQAREARHALIYFGDDRA